MKLVMTLVVRDEDDVLEANLDYHLRQGVDFVIATDHDSEDGTSDILERYAREGYLHLIRETGEEFTQDRWLTHMARMAATEFDADWVIGNDADEFWWPVTGTLKEVFAEIPQEFHVLSAPRPEFLARPGDSSFFADRMVVREVLSRRGPKIAHRALPNVRIEAFGSHSVKLEGSDPCAVKGYSPVLPGVPYWPVRVFHFPLRSYEQFEKRVRNRMRTKLRGRYGRTGERLEGRKASELYRAYREGSLAEIYARRVVDDRALDAGIREGRLTVDRRLQRFFAERREPGGRPASADLPTAGVIELSFGGTASLTPPQADAVETQVDMVQALERRMTKVGCRAERLDARLSAIEGSRWWRLGRGVFRPLVALASVRRRLGSGAE
jgi:hypothetical protein